MRKRAGVWGVGGFILISIIAQVQGANWYVATNGSDSAAGTNWDTAKLTIQAAIDAAASNDTVWVTNGLYTTGGQAVAGTWTNRVAITKPLTVQSVNGPEATVITGGVARCAYVTNGAVLSGFTLTGGRSATGASLPLFDALLYGGGAWCESGGVVTNCIFTGNWGLWGGGGARGGRLDNCLLTENWTDNEGGGTYGTTANSCTFSNNRADGRAKRGTAPAGQPRDSEMRHGGAAFGGVLNHCILQNNSTEGYGGATYNSVLNFCTVKDNWAPYGCAAYYGALSNCVVTGNLGDHADVIYGCTLANCLVTGNHNDGGGAVQGCTCWNCTIVSNTAYGDSGGAYQSTLYNCIVYGNSAGGSGSSNHLESTFFYSCTAPDPGGVSNLDAVPLFMDAEAGDFRLRRDSPCINLGTNLAELAATDLDGKPRLVNDRIDMGAFEFQNGLAILPGRTNLACAAAASGIDVWADSEWTASNPVPWLTITAGASGMTNGRVEYAVASNRWLPARTAAIVVASATASFTCTVVQAGSEPMMELTPSGTNLASDSASVSIAVTANIPWTAHTDVAWLEIGSGSSGDGDGAIVLQAAANGWVAPRTGQLLVSASNLVRTCVVYQSEADVDLAVRPASNRLACMAASNCMLEVGARVSWTAASTVPWVVIRSGSEGTTNGNVVYEVEANATAACRDGAIRVTGGGQAVTGIIHQLERQDWYVATNGTDAADGRSWATAMQTIQSAVDAAEYGDRVWVSNGIHTAGGGVVAADSANRVAIDKPVTVTGVGGAGAVIIDGGGMRCVYATNGAVLSGLTLTGGRAETGGAAYGGVLDHCVLQNNIAYGFGGATCAAVLNHCTLIDNWGAVGCAAYSGSLSNCLIADNTGDAYAVLYECTLVNCLVAGNHNDGGGAVQGCTLYNCTVAGNTTYEDTGGAYQSTLYNCIVYGNSAGGSGSSNHLESTFFNSCTAPDPGGTGNITEDPEFKDADGGDYHLGLNSPCINAANNADVRGPLDLEGNPRILSDVVDMGAYEFVRPTQWFVATNGQDSADGTSWAAAKLTIQAAIDAAVSNDTVWVSNGVYATGGRTVAGSLLTNRAAIDRPITVRSMNGPEVTIIQGSGTNSGGYARCAYVGTQAALSGFTLTNGVANLSGTNRYGGGVFITSGTVEDCHISGNYAWRGAGVYIAGDGLLSHCRVVANSAGDTGGGGGICGEGGQIRNCLVADNYAEWGSGLIISNTTLCSCLVCGNHSFGGPGIVATNSTIQNCIVYSNNVSTNNMEIQAGTTVVTFTCSPGLSGSGNITNNPQFVDAAAGNYRLQAASPCIDAGDDRVVSWDKDLDGNQRIAYGAVDMGAYEAQLAGAGTWFGAITNGRTNDLDCAAGDGVPNLLKYATGGSPRIADDMMRLGLDTDGPPALVFNRNPNATDVRFTVEAANAVSNGAAWRGIATNAGGSWLGATNVDESGTGNPVVCTVTDPVALESNRFLRLRVSRP